MAKKPKKPAPRRRDAAVTRAAILASARSAFARAGYDGAGLREIARGAGVTAMMVNRYFGSKEKLFAEVVAATMAAPVILARGVLGSAKRAQDMAAALVALTEAGATPLDGFRIMLASASSKRAAQIARLEIEKRYQRLLTDALSGSHPAQRAALVFSLVAGVQVMRQIIALSALAEAEPELLVSLLVPLFQRLVGNPASSLRRAGSAFPDS
jgi:AcrR family transcriptional regulator